MKTNFVILTFFLTLSSFASGGKLDERNFQITSFTVEEIHEDEKNDMMTADFQKRDVLEEIVYVVDTLNHRIRKIVISTGMVTVLSTGDDPLDTCLGMCQHEVSETLIEKKKRANQSPRQL